MAERRLTRGARQRFRLRLRWYLLAGLAAVAVLWWSAPEVLRRLEFFRVRRVEIAGSQYLAPAKIIAALGLHERSSVFDDLPAAGAGLRSLPGVRSAIVRRRLPGTLEIAIEEAVPVALAPRGAALTLLDSGGSVLPFDPAANAPDLPIAASVDRTIAQVLASVREHDSVLFGRIETARRMHNDVVLELGGQQIWLPPGVTGEDIRAVSAVAEDLARQGHDYGELDGRFAGQVIVRWKGT